LGRIFVREAANDLRELVGVASTRGRLLGDRGGECRGDPAESIFLQSLGEMKGNEINEAQHAKLPSSESKGQQHN
jgi:hypothetical protein